MNRQGISHIIECTCILPQYSRAKNTIYHRFIVFSIIENDNVIPKFVQCNNCGVIHQVIEICKSKIMQGKDELRSALSINDISHELSNQLSDLLKLNDCPLHIWEHVKFIIDEKRWGEHVIISTDNLDNMRTGKVLVITDQDKFGITQFNEQTGI